MTYTAPNQFFLKNKTGTDSKVISDQLALIDAELDALTTTTGTLTTTTGTHTTALAAGPKVVKVRATGAAQNAQSFAWQNPETTKIIVSRVILHVFDNETVGVGTLMDIGVAANGTTSSDTLIDGVALTAVDIFDNITDKGTHGKTVAVVDENGGTNDFITGTVNTATGASFTGCVYIYYTKVGFLE
jgi:hypothetical protein